MRLIMKPFSIVLGFVLTLSLFISCGNGTGNIVITDTAITSEVLGIKLCEKADKESIENAISKSTDNVYFTYEEKVGQGSGIRCMPVNMSINFGGQTWNYCDVHLNSESAIYEVDLVASFESVERAKDRFDTMVTKLSEKYGKGNVDASEAFWTDGENAIGLSYSESSAINGNDRSFCTLFYINRNLAREFEETMNAEL